MVLNNSPSELAARYPSYTASTGRTVNLLQTLQQFSNMPWVDGTKEAVIQPASNQADINRYIQEGLVQFVTGQKPLTTSSWSTYLQGLSGLGVSDWETAAQKNLQDKGLL
jgi:putative aldouronate transport system substrate-binding protein